MSEATQIAEIIETENRRNEACISEDFGMLEKILGDELVHIHSNGVVHGKQDIIERLRQRNDFVEIQRKNLSVKMYGNVGVMTGELWQKFKIKGKQEMHHAETIVTQVWVKKESGWSQVAFQAAKLPETSSS